VIRSGTLIAPADDVPDDRLRDALRGLRDADGSASVAERAATLTAVAADGAYLRGAVDDETRRASPPGAPLDWTELLGAVDVVAYRAAVRLTDDDERAALTALLRVWADQPFAAPSTWRLGFAPGAVLAPLCAAGSTVAGGRDALDPDRRYRFLQRADAPVPEDAAGVRSVAVERDDAARVRRLLALVAERGPLPFDEDAVAVFSHRTGVRRVLAALAVAGLPRRAEVTRDTVTRFQENERMLRGKPYLADKYTLREVQDAASRLGAEGRRAVVAAALPDDPADLWEPGGTVAAAERMAEEWVRRLGARPHVDEATAAAMQADFGAAHHVRDLADPAASGALWGDLRAVLTRRRWRELELDLVDAAGRAQTEVGGPPYRRHASLIAWALTQRPVGDPALAGVPELHARLRARLAAPHLLVRLNRLHYLGDDADDLARVFGPRTFPVREPARDTADAAGRHDAYDDGVFVVDARRTLQRPFLRPSGLAGPGALDRVERLCADHGWTDLWAEVRSAAVVNPGGGLDRMVLRAAATPVPVGGYEAAPALSVPDLVAEAADTLGVDADAAALYLQLLTLARPTDRNVRTWNGWTAARHRAAQDALLAVGAVVRDRRPRAGRTVFVPGDWTEARAPELPLETAKLATHLALIDTRKEIQGPFDILLPPAPLHEMFAAAWAAR
jgi:hypothetical protein